MKIKYLNLARDDLLWFRAYYRNVFPAGQGNASLQFRRVVQLISEYPDIGTAPDDFQDAFEYPIQRTPFTLIYRVKGDELHILRILDQRNTFSNDRRK